MLTVPRPAGRLRSSRSSATHPRASPTGMEHLPSPGHVSGTWRQGFRSVRVAEPNFPLFRNRSAFAARIRRSHPAAIHIFDRVRLEGRRRTVVEFRVPERLKLGRHGLEICTSLEIHGFAAWSEDGWK